MTIIRVGWRGLQGAQGIQGDPGDPNAYKYYVDASEADQGVGNGESLKAHVDAIGADKATIVFQHDSEGATTTYTLTTSETIPSNIKLVFENGAIIDGAGTLTINGPFNAGLYQTFGSSVTIAFGDLTYKIYPQWFGAYNDGTNAAATIAALQAASDSAPENGTVFFPLGNYAVNDQWTLGSKSLRIEGAFGDPGYSSNNPPSEGVIITSTINDAGKDVINWLFIGVWKSLEIENLSIIGNGNERDGIRLTCTDPTHETNGVAYRVNLKNVSVHDVGGCGFWLYTRLLYSSIWENLTVMDCGSHGFYLKLGYSYGRSQFVKFTNLRANQCAGYGFYCDPFSQAIFEWCKSEYCAGGFYLGSQPHGGTFIECQHETEAGVGDLYGLYAYRADDMSFIRCNFRTGYSTKQAIYLDKCHDMTFLSTRIGRLATLGAGVKAITLVNICTGIDFISCVAPSPSTYDNIAEDDSGVTYTRIDVNRFDFTQLAPGASAPSYWLGEYSTPESLSFTGKPRFIYGDIGIKGAIYPPYAHQEENVTATDVNNIDLSGRMIVFLTLAGAEDITSLSGGKPGQKVTFLIQNGNATFKHTSSVRLSGAADWNPAQYDTITVVCQNDAGNQWRESSRSDNS